MLGLVMRRTLCVSRPASNWGTSSATDPTSVATLFLVAGHTPRCRIGLARAISPHAFHPVKLGRPRRVPALISAVLSFRPESPKPASIGPVPQPAHMQLSPSLKTQSSLHH